MAALIQYLLSIPAVRARLIALGWTPPEEDAGTEPLGPGPWRPPK